MSTSTILGAQQVAACPRAVEAVRALARLSRQLERVSGELSLAHYRVLCAVGAGDERASRVAAKLALGKPTVSASVDSLCRRGLLSRSRVGDDQRAVALALTDEGRDVLDRVERAMVASVSESCARTGNGLAVIDALASLGEAMEAAAASTAGSSRR